MSQRLRLGGGSPAECFRDFWAVSGSGLSVFHGLGFPMVLRFGIQGALVLSSFSPVASPSVPCRGHGRLRHIRPFKVLFGSKNSSSCRAGKTVRALLLLLSGRLNADSNSACNNGQDMSLYQPIYLTSLSSYLSSCLSIYPA